MSFSEWEKVKLGDLIDSISVKHKFDKDQLIFLNTSDVLEGKVVRMLNFGAFVELFPGIEGLVHINEITDENITKPGDILQIGQLVKVKVIDVNTENKKIALSIKDAVERSKEYLQYNDNDEDVTLGDLFKGLFNK